MASKQPCIDHLGNSFNSIASMCKHYNISRSTYNIRTKLGWSLDAILTTPIRTKSIRGNVMDHLGNRFKTISDMCEHYGIGVETYRARLKYGWDLERVLTTPVSKHQSYCIDHRGNKFESEAEMCKHWGVTQSAFRGRFFRGGCSLEEALTTPLNSRYTVYDHLGNAYKSMNDMCKHYNINTYTFSRRVKLGMDLEKALTTPLRESEKPQIDHLGNKFDSIASMCKYWGLDYVIYNSRIKRGWSIKDALTTEVGYFIEDGLGGRYKSIKDMAKHYNINIITLYNRLGNKSDIVTALVVDSKVALGFLFLGLDRKARYSINHANSKPYTTRELIAKYRPDLLSAYDKYNPTGKYEPYRPNNSKEEDTT